MSLKQEGDFFTEPVAFDTPGDAKRAVISVWDTQAYLRQKPTSFKLELGRPGHNIVTPRDPSGGFLLNVEASAQLLGKNRRPL